MSASPITDDSLSQQKTHALQPISMHSLLEQLKHVAHQPADANGGLDHLGGFWEREYWEGLADDANRKLNGITKGVSLTFEGKYSRDDRETDVTWIKRTPGNLKARLQKECGDDWSKVTYGNPAVVYYSDTKIEDDESPGEFIHTTQDKMQALQDLLEQEPKNDMKILVQMHQCRFPENQYHGPLFGRTFVNPSSIF
jgi:hypothetical protein